MSIQQRFAKFEKANYYSRVSSNHILELYIGLDDKCRKAIELRYPFVPQKVIGTTSLEVNQYHKEGYNVLRFSLCNEETAGLFYTFCEDLIEHTKELTDESEGYKTILARFSQWKKMFVSSKKAFLSEPEIMGLIGEILFLRDDLAKRIGLSAALQSWSGQEPTRKDFSFGDNWYEVKTISSLSRSIKISSAEQLESDTNGELIVHILEKMSSAYTGITLNELVLQTRSLFDSLYEQELFYEKVSRQGYEYNSYYDTFVYETRGRNVYRVNSNFPKLTRTNMPSAIIGVTYEISLPEISAFQI